MSLPSLTIIPAGAGSGKTYTIQERLDSYNVHLGPENAGLSEKV